MIKIRKFFPQINISSQFEIDDPIPSQFVTPNIEKVLVSNSVMIKKLSNDVREQNKLWFISRFQIIFYLFTAIRFLFAYQIDITKE